MIREIFSDNPIFYNIYFHLFRKHRGIRPSYFSSETDIYYDGYQRSGNTFLHHLISELFPDLNGVHHLHKIAPIKIALNRNIPVFILIRDPEEAISSNYLKHYAPTGSIPDTINIGLLNKMTDDYYRYYKFVHKNQRKIEIINFDELINNSSGTIKNIADAMNINISDYSVIENKLNKASESYSGAKTKYGSSKPNVHKEKEKKKIKNDFFKINQHKKAIEIYREIIN